MQQIVKPKTLSPETNQQNASQQAQKVGHKQED